MARQLKPGVPRKARSTTPLLIFAILVMVSCASCWGFSFVSRLVNGAFRQSSSEVVATSGPMYAPTLTRRVVRMTATFLPSATATLTLEPSKTMRSPYINQFPTETPTPTFDGPTATRTMRSLLLTPRVVDTNTPQPPVRVATLPVQQPTAVPPTAAPLPTDTPVVASGSSGYDHNGDGKVTCADFSTQAEAQEAYNAGYTRLDGNDNDGRACESLP